MPPNARACRVGEPTWRPLAVFPELAPPPSNPAPPPPPPPPPASAKPPAAGRWATAVGVVVLAGLGYGLYEAARDPTPREVAARFLAAPTAAEARGYATARLYPAVDAMAARRRPPAPADGDDTTITHDAPAPAGAGGHHVWARTTAPDPATGRPVPVEVRLHLVPAGGWKVDDVEFTGYDGRPVDPPVSLARDYRQFFPPPPAGKPAPARSDGRARAAARVGVFGLVAAVKSGGAKAVGVGVLAALAGLWAWFRRGGRPTA